MLKLPGGEYEQLVNKNEQYFKLNRASCVYFILLIVKLLVGIGTKFIRYFQLFLPKIHVGSFHFHFIINQGNFTAGGKRIAQMKQWAISLD